MRIALKDATLITPERIIKRGILLVENKRIKDLGYKIKLPKNTEVVRLPGKYIVPGFIDLHVHGALGEDFSSTDEAGYDKISFFFLKHGITTLLPTIYPRSKHKFIQSINQLVHYCRKGINDLPIYGIHLEGPFLNPQRSAALKPDRFWKATLPHWQRLRRAGKGFIRMMTLAPEIPGGKTLLKKLLEDRVTPSLGHSTASYEQMQSFIKLGLTNVTHIFNTFNPIHHRAPGALTSALLNQKVFTHLIGDGIHIHEPIIRLLLKLKGIDKICLISDANIACGMPSGNYNFSGYKIRLKNGIAKTLDGRLAGSVMPLDMMLKYMVEIVGISLPDAVKMVTSNPAHALGIERTRGSLAPGKRADLVVLDKNLSVKMVFLGGRCQYENRRN